MKDGKVKNEPVIFRTFSNGDCIAMFPEIATDTMGYMCQSYMHVGQHSAANPNLVFCTTPSRPSEYKALFKELTELGYDLKIIKRFRYSHQKTRMAMYN